MIWTSQDLVRLASLVAGYLATGMVPRRWDGAAGDALLRVARPFFPQRELAQRISDGLGSRLAARSAGELADQWLRFYVEDAWGRARDLHGRGSRLRTMVTGGEHLEAARAEGRGAILWVMPFCGSRVFKAALWHDRIPLVHLGRENHAVPSTSWLALRIVSPFHRRAEGRYLVGTIIVPFEGFPRALGRLKDVLRQNQCLSMNAAGFGQQEMTIDLLGQPTPLATGPPALAHATGAALLPAYAEHSGRLEYRAVIERPLESDRTLPRRDFVSRAVQEFGGRVEAQLVRRPQDWSPWRARPHEARRPAR